MSESLIFAPLLPLWLIAGLALMGLAALGFALWMGLRGAWWRLSALAVLLAALVNPSLQREERQALSDIVVVMVDESASQRIADRAAQTEAALADLTRKIAALPETEMVVWRIGDAEGDLGTTAMARLTEGLTEIPRERLAGVFLISDGQVHDVAAAPELPSPLHLVQTGQPQDWDRRLIVKNAPAFAILNETVTLILRIEDQGAVPADAPRRVPITLRLGAEPAIEAMVPVGEDLELPVRLPHGGINVLQASIPAEATELTDRNNAAVLRINAVRDRLRVLLVSGEPHAGERVWRNLLKSDAAVDLVHFTILRPPEKQDGAPVDELSLIAFPTRELFVEKIREFDLIIFDRYRRRGIMPNSYLANVRDYVRAGGALLIAAGPEFGTADSLWRSPLADVLPADPSSRVIEEGFRPLLTDLGARHPVTAGLQPEGAEWGRWFRQIDLRPKRGQVVMTGIDARPLLLLDRVGEGRVGLLASDQIWLWGRGFEGGGPQLELLRRLAHWSMKEPELEEEALLAEADGLRLRVIRRTVGEAVGPVRVTLPDGSTHVLTLEQQGPGLWQAEWLAPDMGLYELREGDLGAVVALGPAAPKEFEETVASAEKLAPVLQATGGGVHRVSGGMPDLRKVDEGRASHGRGWLGITTREAHVTTDLRVAPLLPIWLWAGLALLAALAAWLYEGRRRGGTA